MANTTMANLINPQVMGDMIEAKITALLKITPYAKVDTTLQGVAGDTKTVPSWNYIGDAEDIAEGAEVGLTGMSASTSTFTIKKAMKAVGITQEAVNSGLGNPIGQAETQLAKAIAGKVDQDVFDAAIGATVAHDSKTAQIGYSVIMDCVDDFDEEDITDKAMFVHPKQITKLRKDSDFIDKNKYGNEVMVTGEIGMVGGVRVVPSKKVPLIKYTVGASGDTGALSVVASGAVSGTSVLGSTVKGCTWDATNKKVVSPATGDYVVPVTANYYLNPIIKLEASNSETEFSEDELPAVTIFLKKDTQTDAEWKPRTQCHEITTAKYYGVALTNAAKVVRAEIKA